MSTLLQYADARFTLLRPTLFTRKSRSVSRNEVAPLIVIAVIAVAAAVALIALIGLAAAWLAFCQNSYGGNYWPTVGVPGHNGSFYYFGCKYVK